MFQANKDAFRAPILFCDSEGRYGGPNVEQPEATRGSNSFVEGLALLRHCSMLASGLFSLQAP